MPRDNTMNKVVAVAFVAIVIFVYSNSVLPGASSLQSVPSQVSSYVGGMIGGGGTPPGSSTSASSGPSGSPTMTSTPTVTFQSGQSPRFGLDLTWYAKNAFGSLHGVNCGLNPSGCYTYLVHGWKNSGGNPDGSCGNVLGCSGGAFTVFSYEMHNPPLYPPNWVSPVSFEDENWILGFIHAANADSGGQKAKVIVRFILENNFDASVYGAADEFLSKLGPSQNNPSVLGFGFRGAQEGIDTGGGASSGGCEGSNFVPSNVAYGTTGMNSFPQSSSQEQQMWSSFQQKVNAYGYTLGISTGLSDMDTCVSPAYYAENSLAQWMIQGPTITPSNQANYVQGTFNSFQSFVTCASICKGGAVSIGTVNGEWDPNWFVTNQTTPLNYGIDKQNLQASLAGFAQGAKLYPAKGQVYMIYGMPYLTNDDSASIAAHGQCPFFPWMLQAATSNGFLTDFSPVPTAPGPISASPPNPPYTVTPTGLYIHILGDSALDSLKPGYSQTDPVHCCGADTFTIDGQLINLVTGYGVPNEPINIMEFNFATGQWFILATVTTTAQGYYGQSSNCVLCSPIKLPSPVLPNTQRNQAYFYPAFSGDSSYAASNGVLEDLPVLP